MRPAGLTTLSDTPALPEPASAAPPVGLLRLTFSVFSPVTSVSFRIGIANVCARFAGTKYERPGRGGVIGPRLRRAVAGGKVNGHATGGPTRAVDRDRDAAAVSGDAERRLIELQAAAGVVVLDGAHALPAAERGARGVAELHEEGFIALVERVALDGDRDRLAVVLAGVEGQRARRDGDVIARRHGRAVDGVKIDRHRLSCSLPTGSP